MTRDLKQSNLELEQRKRFVETLLANITAGVIAVDPAGRITTWNKTAEEMLGVEAAGVLGKNQQDVFQVGQLQVMRDILESVKDRESVERKSKSL